MGVRTWRFFHRNDGTTIYQDNDVERNLPLWERIQDLEDQNARLSTRIEEYQNQLMRYQGMVSPGEVVQGISIINLREYSNPLFREEVIREQLVNDQLRNLMQELRDRNLIDIDFSTSDSNPNELRLRTRIRVLPIDYVR